MKSHATAEKIFVRDRYTLILRSARALRISIEPRPAYVVVLLLRGELNFGTPELKPPAALLAAPGDTLEARGRDAETLTLTLAPAFLLDAAVRARLTRDDALITFRPPAVTNDARLAEVARSLAAELRDEDAGHEIVLDALVEQLVVNLLRRHANISRRDELELSRVGLVDRRVRRAVELMHARLDRELPLEELAAAAYLSPFHFARLFKKATGASPHAYLAALRIERAQQLLASTDLSVTEIGSRVGYQSPSHFGKAFRRATGLAPRAFRAGLVAPRTDAAGPPASDDDRPERANFRR
ncbi:MAG TPA: helix-turn-helix domain-containing protein [Pyrinomonadaceae bacterium]|nr:helix-turn-helix domain-containing protein [Pyrinomonadaceae bacterium]